jgi:hypothetical protein
MSGCGSTDLEDAGSALRSLAKSANEKAVEAASEKLHKLTEDDAIEKQLEAAVCNGLTSLANTDELPNNDEWESFLISQVEAASLGVSLDEIENKVKEFEASSHIASVSPPVATQYLRACTFKAG